jgi:putative transposase
LKAIEFYLTKDGTKSDQACVSPQTDRDAQLPFDDFLAEHGRHLRTTNPTESTFATIRLRHRRTKGNKTRQASLAMMLNLAQSASKH